MTIKERLIKDAAGLDASGKFPLFVQLERDAAAEIQRLEDEVVTLTELLKEADKGATGNVPTPTDARLTPVKTPTLTPTSPTPAADPGW